MSKITLNKIISLSILALLIAWAPLSSADVIDHYFDQAKNKHNVTLFFVQNAEQADIKPLGNACYQVTLKNIDQQILYFSDRPNRIVGHISNKRFADLWQDQAIRPNLVLHGDRNKNNTNTSYQVVLTIGNANVNYHDDGMRYDACLTDKKVEPRINVKTLHNVVLFIDPWRSWQGG